MAKSIRLDKFTGIKHKVNYEKILDKYGKKTVDVLHNTSPHSDRPGRKTPYKDGWTADERYSSKTNKKVVVWNKTNWQLTHLLENGHFVTNLRSGISWVSPRPHIHEAYKKIAPQYIKAMEKVEIEFEFK